MGHTENNSEAEFSLHVILVDDDEAVARMCGRVLQRLGHLVETFLCPEEALKRITSAPSSFDVVITDHRMPGMTGQELLERMYEAGVTAPALILSGYSDEVDSARLARYGVGPVLEKPFTLSDLKARLADLCGGLDSGRDASGAA